MSHLQKVIMKRKEKIYVKKKASIMEVGEKTIKAITKLKSIFTIICTIGANITPRLPCMKGILPI